MSTANATSHLQQYLVGFVLAIVLTAVPFGLVASGALSHTLTMAAITVAALVQIFVHLRYFLHLSFSPKDSWFVLSMAFTVLILVIMIGGTIWVVADLNKQMMTMPMPVS